MHQLPPDRLPAPLTAGQQPVPAHHRPPNVLYDEYGRPVHFTIGQPLQPPPAYIQVPQQQGLPPELQRLIIITFLILAVVVVCTGALCAIVVLMGGTLIGIIGAVGQNLTTIALTLVGIIVAAGWAASKLKPATKKKQ